MIPPCYVWSKSSRAKAEIGCQSYLSATSGQNWKASWAGSLIIHQMMLLSPALLSQAPQKGLPRSAGFGRGSSQILMRQDIAVDPIVVTASNQGDLAIQKTEDNSVISIDAKTPILLLGRLELLGVEGRVKGIFPKEKFLTRGLALNFPRQLGVAPLEFVRVVNFSHDGRKAPKDCGEGKPCPAQSPSPSGLGFLRILD